MPTSCSCTFVNNFLEITRLTDVHYLHPNFYFILEACENTLGVQNQLIVSKGSACFHHYSDVIMGAMASQITSITIVYSTVNSGADQRKKHQSSASLVFMWGIHRRIPRTNGQQRGKCLHLMTSLWWAHHVIIFITLINWYNNYITWPLWLIIRSDWPK